VVGRRARAGAAAAAAPGGRERVARGPEPVTVDRVPARSIRSCMRSTT
jgi:hypothetical protein